MEALLQEIYNLKMHKEIIETNIERLKGELASVSSVLDDKEATLLRKLLEQDLLEVESGELVGFKQSKKSVGYTSDSDVVNILKTQFDNKYVKTKVTESLDKNALKKALKVDAELNELLAPYILNGTTDYVVVTTKANRERMLEHINEAR